MQMQQQHAGTCEVVHCRYAREHQTIPWSTQHAARVAQGLFRGFNSRHRQGTGAGPVDRNSPCVLGFAAQCVAIDKRQIAAFYQNHRGQGQPIMQGEMLFCNRVRHVLSYAKRARMSEVLVFGNSANTQLTQALKQQEFKMLVCRPSINLN